MSPGGSLPRSSRAHPTSCSCSPREPGSTISTTSPSRSATSRPLGGGALTSPLSSRAWTCSPTGSSTTATSPAYPRCSNTSPATATRWRRSSPETSCAGSAAAASRSMGLAGARTWVDGGDGLPRLAVVTGAGVEDAQDLLDATMRRPGRGVRRLRTVVGMDRDGWHSAETWGMVDRRRGRPRWRDPGRDERLAPQLGLSVPVRSNLRGSRGSSFAAGSSKAGPFASRRARRTRFICSRSRPRWGCCASS